MKSRCRWITLALLVITICSCGIIRNSPKKSFSDGFYTQTINNTKSVVYVDVADDILYIMPTSKNNHFRIDTSQPYRMYPKEMKDTLIQGASFGKSIFDVDFLTIPIKFRPAQKNVPLQLNTNLNGAVYLGYRMDKYNVRYMINPLQKSERIINHYGFSLGIFTGLGNTAMTPTTTDNRIAIEYDGVVWTKGIAGIIGINNFTVGLAIGFDTLLDENNNNWIYKNRPWFGLAFGLNLN